MSKLEREVVVKFRRKHAIKGNMVVVTKMPTDIDVFVGTEYDALHAAIVSGETFYVHDGDQLGALIQLPDVHDLTWMPADCLERIL